MNNKLIGVLCLALAACRPAVEHAGQEQASTPEPALTGSLAGIQLPDGFRIGFYAEDVPNARSLCISPSGTLFVGTRDAGSIYALRDDDGDGKADRRWVLATGMQQPNGVAWRDGDLYVAEISRIWKFPDIERQLEDPKRELFFDQYPDKTHHGWKYIAFGPDGKLYVPVGAPCNICESDDPLFGTITRLDLATKEREIVQTGIRNSVGFTWHPQTRELWFTDNGGDWLGDDMPSCELNHAPADGMNFGYPYCHQGDFPDPKLGAGHACEEFTPPTVKLGAHVAPLGLEFYTGNMFPESWRNVLFIAEHGSWNRTEPSGYQVVSVKLDGNRVVEHKPFATGWLRSGKAWGRPVDIELLPDGSMLVSDDHQGAIYRIYYAG